MDEQVRSGNDPCRSSYDQSCAHEVADGFPPLNSEAGLTCRIPLGLSAEVEICDYKRGVPNQQGSVDDDESGCEVLHC